MTSSDEHSFAQYIRILGKGKNTSRSLTYEESYTAFTHILKKEVEPIQLGAFLLLLRVKGEDANEMAGFAKAAQDFIQAPPISVDIDWPSYAGKHKQQAWFILAALLLAQNGARIFMHGSSIHFGERLYTERILQELGIPICQNWLEVEQQLNQHCFAYSPLNTFCKPLDDLFSCRPLLGVRSAANSLIKLVNPLRAHTSLQSVFHPAYLEIHQQAAQILGQPRSLVLKGEGGEIEFRPDADNRLFLLDSSLATEDQCREEKWLRRQPERQEKLDIGQLSAQALLDFWSAAESDSYGLNALLGTVAMVIFAAGKAGSEADAWELADTYWSRRKPSLT